VLKYTILVHTWIVTMNGSFNTSSSLTILTRTFYVKHKMMAPIKKLQDKLNKKETLISS